MASIKFKGKHIHIFLCIMFLCLFMSCIKNRSNYPQPIERAINLFFIENEYDSIINILNNKNLMADSGDFEEVKNIFIAAALSESDMQDSARTILLNIDSTYLNENDRYYYYTIRALVEFRLNKLQEFMKIATPLLSAEVKDIRALALTQRLMSRTMNLYENYEIAIRLLQNSSELYRLAKLKKSEAINKKFLASYYAQLGSFDLAIENLNEAEKTFKEYDDKEELYYLYIVGVKTYILQNQTDIARKYANLALTTISGNINNQKLASIYNYLGTIEKLDSNYNDAINMFVNVTELDRDYFGSNTREIEAYINLSSIYNSVGDYDKAKKNAAIALNKIKNNENTFLKYEAFRELSVGYHTTDPLLAYNYLDSAKYSLERYQELSSKGIADFVNTQNALVGANNQIVQLQEIDKRNRIINILAIAVILMIIASYFIVKGLSKRVKETSTELVKKNLAQLKYEKEVNAIFKKHDELAENQPNNSISLEHKSEILFNKFNSWLEKEKKYLQSDLDLNMAAREIGTNRSYLSKSINQHGVGFSEIINRYRILEVIKIFEDDEDERNSYTLPEIAVAVGFKTKSVFYESFRKETGMTPSQFKENIQYTKL